MKNLNLYIKESLLDDENALMKNTGDEAIKNEILKFLKDNYIGVTKCKISKKPINGKYVVDCYGSLIFEDKNITSLTNEYFEFGVVDRNFNCSYCDSLTTLKGAPKKVGGDFTCSNCESLKSLEGGPKEVGGNFYCFYCKSLKSLKGAPKEVGGKFDCSDCKTQFSIEDVEKVSKVNVKIFC